MSHSEQGDKVHGEVCGFTGHTIPSEAQAAVTTGEWTVEEDGEFCVLQSPTHGNFLFPRSEVGQVKSVADCINAALDTAYEKGKQDERIQHLIESIDSALAKVKEGK